MKLGLLVQQAKQKLHVLKNKDVDEREMKTQEWRKTYTASYLHRLHSPTSAFWVNGRLKWARHAAC